MPQAVTYWTTWFSPGVEGISNEVACLARHFAGSTVFCMSRHQGLRIWFRPRALAVHPLGLPLLRAMYLWSRRRHRLIHCFTSLESWYLLKVLDFSPHIFTVTGATAGRAGDNVPNARLFVAESPWVAEVLLSRGVDRDRIRLIYPGVDLRRFHPASRRRDRRIRILFASSPTKVEDMEARGVWRLLEWAQHAPTMEVVLAWRPFSPGKDAVRRWVAERGLRNVRLLEGRVRDMPMLINSSDFVAAPFDENAGKGCPNSILEGLACGKPALLPDAAFAAPFLEAGVAVPMDASPQRAVEGIRASMANYDKISRAARAFAEAKLSLDRFLADYQGLYEAVSEAI